jgi:MFS family permease
VRSFQRLFLAATISNFGTMLHAIAMPFVAIVVLDATPGDLALLGAAGLLPGFVLGLFASTWVDRLRRRPLLIAADLIRAAVILFIPAAAALGRLELYHLYVVVSILGLLNFTFEVAHHAILPSIVEDDQLVDANAKLRASESVTEGAAFAAGGWIIQLLSAPIALVVDSVSFVFSAVFLAGLPAESLTLHDEAAEGEDHSGILSELKEGVAFLMSDARLLAGTCAAALLDFGWRTAGCVYLIFVYEELGFAPGVLGMIFAAGGVSSFFGAISVEPITRRLGRGWTMIFGMVLFGLSMLVLPFARDAGWIALGILIAHQLGDGFEVIFGVNNVSLRQSLTPNRLIGRVTGCAGFASSGAMLLGLAVGGTLGETLGLRATLVVAGCAPILGALVIAMSPLRHER